MSKKTKAELESEIRELRDRLAMERRRSLDATLTSMTIFSATAANNRKRWRVDADAGETAARADYWRKRWNDDVEGWWRLLDGLGRLLPEIRVVQAWARQLRTMDRAALLAIGTTPEAIDKERLRQVAEAFGFKPDTVTEIVEKAVRWSATDDAEEA